ncbi:transposase, partial [candidate division KSB1 bacterium]|nr:transposase [candidate division KSB1 bacterium]
MLSPTRNTSTVMARCARFKEKSSKSYKGIFGYHPLLIHLHNTGELLDVVLRSGRDFTSGDAAAILETNLRRLKPYFDEIILLADSGFYEKAIVDVCEHDDLKIKFIITCELNAPIKQRLTDPQLAWRAPQAEPEENRANIEHRDSHSFNYRIQNLKEALAKRGKNLKVRGELEVAEFDHTVTTWKKDYRFIFKRQLIFELNPLPQAEIFEATDEYFYHGYVTNIKDQTIEEIIDLIDSRGHQENFIKDFKYGLGTVHIPSKHFYGNYAYFLISMLSWNLKCWLLSVIEPELQIQ